MEIGISTASLFLRALNEDAVGVLKGLKTEVTEVFLATFSEYTKAFGELLKARAGDMKIRSVHTLCTHFEPQLYSEHPRAKKDAFTTLDQVLDTANAMGATHYTFHGTTRLKSRAPTTDYAVMGKKTETIRQACEDRGVTLCFENVSWAAYSYPGFFRGIKEYCPKLQGVLDIKQADRSGYPVIDYIRDMSGAIATVHVSDVNEDGKMCLPGRGKTDFKELFTMLKDHGFDGTLLIEAYKDDYDGVMELAESVNYLKSL